MCSVSPSLNVFDEKLFALLLPEALPIGFYGSLLLNLFNNVKILIPLPVLRRSPGKEKHILSVFNLSLSESSHY